MKLTSKSSARAGVPNGAILVGAGMILSRISGFARSTLFAGAFGVQSVQADAFNAATKLPNFLQNLLGEGVLSASLIPAYARQLSAQGQAAADALARAVFGMLVAIVAVIVAGGLVAAPWIVRLANPGFGPDVFDLTVFLVRVTFPGIAVLVLSAWCLAVLSSHRRFFLSYAAPVLWNAAAIGCLIFFKRSDPGRLVVLLAISTVVGALLQFGVQLPAVWRIMSPHWGKNVRAVKADLVQVFRSAVPVVFSRGVVQVSSLVDSAIATFLPLGAYTALTNATQIYQLPVSLFGMSITSAALPKMASESSSLKLESLAFTLEKNQRLIAVLSVPASVAFIVLGTPIVRLLFQHGRFTASDTTYVAAILAGSAIGLVATTTSRLYASAFYALGDTRTPLRFAVIRVVVVGALGFLCALAVPTALGVSLRWGTVGLTASAGIAGWLEFALLRAALRRAMRPIPLATPGVGKLWITAFGAAAVIVVLSRLGPTLPFRAGDPLCLSGFGLLYLGAVSATKQFPVGEVFRRRS